MLLYAGDYMLLAISVLMRLDTVRYALDVASYFMLLPFGSIYAGG